MGRSVVLVLCVVAVLVLPATLAADCEPPVDNCASCKGDAVTDCETCNEGYVLSGAACDACAVNCTSCTVKDECNADGCVAGSTFKADSKTCEAESKNGDTGGTGNTGTGGEGGEQKGGGGEGDGDKGRASSIGSCLSLVALLAVPFL